MPWSVHKDDRCPAAKPWGVVKESDGSLEGCHPSKEAGLKQSAALYASEAAMTDELDERDAWTTAYINALPPSAFACPDERKYPHHDATGKVDPAHLANARARVRQDGTSSCGYDHLFNEHSLPSDEASMTPPRDDLVRAIFPGAELRDADSGPGTMFGHLAPFNQWTLIDSAFEGRFMERLSPGAFAKTITENGSQMRVTFNHGKDPTLGNQILGLPEVLREDDQGVYYEVPLLEGLPPLVLAGLRRGAYGSSFRFRVNKEDFKRNPGKSAYNPEGIPERTVREVSMSEFGPVTFPAYAGATAGVRSLTDDYLIDRLIASPHIQELLRGTALPDVGAEPAHSDEGSRKPEAPPPDAADQPPKDPAKAGSSLVRRFRTKEEYIEWIRRS
jgi:hypothetical protein